MTKLLSDNSQQKCCDDCVQKIGETSTECKFSKLVFIQVIWEIFCFAIANQALIEIVDYPMKYTYFLVECCMGRSIMLI